MQHCCYNLGMAVLAIRCHPKKCEAVHCVTSQNNKNIKDEFN